MNAGACRSYGKEVSRHRRRHPSGRPNHDRLPEFFSEGARNAKIKTPFEFVVSAVRATGDEPRNINRLIQKLNELATALPVRRNPTGYSTMAAEWVNSSGLLVA